jgi:hypothetical protein
LLFLLPFLFFLYIIFHFVLHSLLFLDNTEDESSKLPAKVYSTTRLEKAILEWHHHRSSLVPPDKCVLGNFNSTSHKTWYNAYNVQTNLMVEKKVSVQMCIAIRKEHNWILKSKQQHDKTTF